MLLWTIIDYWLSLSLSLCRGTRRIFQSALNIPKRRPTGCTLAQLQGDPARPCEHFSRKFISNQKWMNFGTTIDGHNGHKISKNREWEIFVTVIFFEFFNFDLKYLQKVPLKKFCDFWLHKASWGWRAGIWLKTGTRSSFRNFSPPFWR